MEGGKGMGGGVGGGGTNGELFPRMQVDQYKHINQAA